LSSITLDQLVKMNQKKEKNYAEYLRDKLTAVKHEFDI